MTVLVIEDETVNRRVACRLLETCGARAIGVGTGEAAIDLLSGTTPPTVDAVLVDLQLPGIDGVETTARLRHPAAGFAAVPVVGLTAASCPVDREALLRAGARSVLIKPATLDDVQDAIRLAVGLDHHAWPTGEHQPSRTARPERISPERIAPAGSAFDAEVLDGDVLERLSAELDDRAAVVRLVDAFLDRLDERAATLTRALRDGDGVGIRRAAHVLRSAAELVGAADVARLCSALEAGATVGTPELMDALDPCRTILRHWQRERGASRFSGVGGVGLELRGLP